MELVVYAMAAAAALFLVVRYAQQYQDFLRLKWQRELKLQQKREQDERMERLRIEEEERQSHLFEQLHKARQAAMETPAPGGTKPAAGEKGPSA